jgi:7-cyano-7-deazaguanine synthase in queuosine biosynthesis
MSKKHVVVSLSGGMDSSTLLLRCLKEYDTVTAISFDYGQKHRIELKKAQYLIDYINGNPEKLIKSCFPINYRQIQLNG